MREIFSLGKLKGINLTRFSPQFSLHFSPHMSGARFTASTICTFFLEIPKKISPVSSAELPNVGEGPGAGAPFHRAECERDRGPGALDSSLPVLRI